MTLATLPVPHVRSVTRSLARWVSVTRSPFTGTIQTQDWGITGATWWEYEIEIALLTGRNGQRMSAFLAQLGGMAGRFLFADPSIRNATGVGSPLVNGAGQTGTSLITDGWSTAGLLQGDFFSLGTDTSTRLYQVTKDVVPVAGAATIEFVPPLRSSPADNAALQVVAPQVVLRPTSTIPATIQRADKYTFSFSAREAI